MVQPLMSLLIRPLPYYTDVDILEKVNISQATKFVTDQNCKKVDKQETIKSLMSIQILPLPNYINDISVLDVPHVPICPANPRKMYSQRYKAKIRDFRGIHSQSPVQPFIQHYVDPVSQFPRFHPYLQLEHIYNFF